MPVLVQAKTWTMTMSFFVLFLLCPRMLNTRAVSYFLKSFTYK